MCDMCDMYTRKRTKKENERFFFSLGAFLIVIGKLYLLYYTIFIITLTQKEFVLDKSLLKKKYYFLLYIYYYV
jgi:hypothetical protein